MGVTRPPIDAAPLLSFDRLLDDATLEGVRRVIADWSVRHGNHGTAASGQPLFFELPPPLAEAFVHRLSRLVPLARRHLGIDHFRLGETVLAVGVHRPGDSLHSLPSNATAARRRIDFVLHLDGTDGPFIGGRLSVARRSPDGPEPSALRFEQVEPSDNRIVLFGSDAHHQVEPTRALDSSSSTVRYTVWGWIAAQADADDPRSGVQAAPQASERLSEVGFEVRPIPVAVHELLRSLLTLRSGRLGPERADPAYHLGPDNDFIDVTDMADEVFEALRPLHEEFAGRPLIPSAMYGLRVYRHGAVLDMHRDRAGTHVVSSVLQIAQDVDVPWPIMLEVGDRTHELILGPGQMLLYEGSTFAHGRPRPLAGRSFVNLFVHYRLDDRSHDDGVPPSAAPNAVADGCP